MEGFVRSEVVSPTAWGPTWVRGCVQVNETEFFRDYWQQRPLYTGGSQGATSVGVSVCTPRQSSAHLPLIFILHAGEPGRIRKIQRLLSLGALEALTQSPAFARRMHVRKLATPI